MHKLFVAILVTFLCFVSVSAQDNFASTDAFLKTILTDHTKLDSEAKGDLNNDRLADWAGLIHREKPNQAPTYQLYVLVRLPQGGYRLAEKSKEEQIPGMGCCWVEDLRIERSSIFIQNNAKTATTIEAATHQFKFYKGEWRLVGIKIYYVDNSSDASTETDMNVLTGAVVEKKQKGNRRPTTTRKRKKFGSFLLKDYDFVNTFGTA